LEIYTSHITFSNFFTYFYAYSKILDISNHISMKEKLNKNIYEIHSDKNISNLYQALYTATPIDKNLQTVFSSLGVSHLLAISGFHLGVLSGLLLFLFKYPYQILQNRYFPYRNSKVDIFIAIVGVLFTYLIFLDSPPSLVRAFFMLIIGFILYDRGIKIISMQTLFLTIIILISFFPRLVFSLGFWLSVSGVFYIFLALIYFKNLSKVWQSIIIPIWTYLMMLPFSLVIFGNFSIYHPLSILWTVLFSIFYPLSIFLHIIGFGDIFDTLLKYLIELAKNNRTLNIDNSYLYIHIVLSLASLWKKHILFLLIIYAIWIFYNSITP